MSNLSEYAWMPSTRSIAIVLTFALASGLIAAERTITRLDGSRISYTDIDAAVTRMMRAGNVAGLGVAILNNRKVAFLKTYGYRDAATRQPLSVDSVITSASFTKSTFAYAAMRLVEDGVLSLDRPVQSYLSKPLPDYAGYDGLAGDDRYRRITIRMLLDHTAGFHNLRSLNKGRIVINFEPGSRYAYSGEGLRLLQLVTEEVTRTPLRALMQARIFEPFGMRRSSMTWEPAFESDYALPHDQKAAPLPLRRRMQADAAGSMQTTLADFARFIQGVMQRKHLKRTTRESMFSPQIEIRSRRQFPTLSTETTDANRAIRLSYGLGWGLYFSPAGKAIFKEGHDDGWQHYTVMFDDAGTGIVLMSNSDNAEGIFQGLLETLLRNTWTPVEWEGYVSVL